MPHKAQQNPWIFDVRVRERNLKAGLLTEKEVEKRLAALPDLADQTESFGASQPALQAPAELDDEDDGDDGSDGAQG